MTEKQPGLGLKRSDSSIGPFNSFRSRSIRKKFNEMAAEAVRTSGIALRAYVKLQVPDVKNILMNCK